MQGLETFVIDIILSAHTTAASLHPRLQFYELCLELATLFLIHSPSLCCVAFTGRADAKLDVCCLRSVKGTLGKGDPTIFNEQSWLLL
jgi:hypothetical protein